MAKIIETKELIEKDGMLFECKISRRLIPKKWYQFFKKNKYEIVLKLKFVRATRPSLKILMEC